MSTALATLTTNMAKRFELGESNAQELMTTLKATAFKGQVSDAQMTALMLVAQQYGLNPWTREIYAFPDRQNGIVPVVGVDGWSRIINENVQFDGIDFEQDDDSCTCIIYRKDRSHPIKVTEWLSECKRDNTGPWKSHPKRMLRHKALIQCARLAFGFVGIYDQDEAERIVEIDVQSGEKVTKKEPANEKPALEYCPDDRFLSNQESWRKAILSGKKSVADLIAMLETKYLLTDEQKLTIDSWSHEGD
jgi:phage recombination protein Bet